MRTRDTSTGAPCWIDLMTSDTSIARSFYADLFGWTALDPSPEFEGYFMFNKGDAPVAGCMPAEHGSDAPHDIWMTYLASDDAQKTVEAATAAGGQAVVQPMPVADLGTMAVVLDPNGAAIGLWQPGAFPGITITGEHGLPSWFELHTTDYAKTVDFYRDAFGWQTETMSDTPEFKYTVLKHSEELAGIMDASGWPEGAALFWSIYFWVDDADAAAARAAELGGSVLRTPEDTPYGRLAVLKDPNGAQFNIMAANAQMPAGG